MKTLLSALLCTTLAACGGSGGGSSGGVPITIPPVAATIPDPALYLVQASCNGGLPNLCVDPVPVSYTAPLPWRKRDWPAPDGYQTDDSVPLPTPNTFLHSFSYPPFGGFDAANGDGGDVIEVDPDAVRIIETRDGGTPHDQYFTGMACGGTGWVLFRDDAASTWQGLLATLSDQSSPSACGTGSQAYTRYERIDPLAVPFIVGGNPETIPVDAIVSEHFSGSSIADAKDMERFIFGAGWGRIAWMHLVAPGQPYNPPGNLAARCPIMDLIPAPAGYRVDDCRLYTQIEPGGFVPSSYGWP